jgi:hypothetical protein
MHIAETSCGRIVQQKSIMVSDYRQIEICCHALRASKGSPWAMQANAEEELLLRRRRPD